MRSLLCTLLLLALPVHAAPLPPEGEALQAAAGADARFDLDARRGLIRYAWSANGLPSPGPRSEDPALRFLRAWGPAFGVDHPEDATPVARWVDGLGQEHRTFSQDHLGLPVFGSTIHVHLERDVVRAVNGRFARRIGADPHPSISAAEAEQTPSRHHRAGQVLGVPSLGWFDAARLRGDESTARLAWEVTTLDDSGHRQSVFVDAHTARVLGELDRSPTLHRELHETTGPTSTGTVWIEGDPLPTDDASVLLIDAAGTSAEVFRNLGLINVACLQAGCPTRDSFDGLDATMGMVSVDPAHAEEDDCPNAWWDGSATWFCDGLATHDVAVHEWGHAWTEHLDGLVYAYQPGALNESASDAFAELVDIWRAELDGVGSTPLRNQGDCVSGAAQQAGSSTRWLVGSDTDIGALRDMWKPGCFRDPATPTQQRYYCGDSDSGGVHTNSGVPNRLLAVTTDGFSAGGSTFAGIGTVKAAHIWYRAKAVYQWQLTDFADHATALELACDDLTIAGELVHPYTGTASGEAIAADDCAVLSAAIDAVGLRQTSRCTPSETFSPAVPETCAGALTQTGLLASFEAVGGFTTSVEALGNDVQGEAWMRTEAPFSTLDGDVSWFAEAPSGGDCNTLDGSARLLLTSPTVTLAPGTRRLSFDHRVLLEDRYDAGVVEIQVDGRAWQRVPAEAFSHNGYNTQMADDSPYPDEQLFSGIDFDSLWARSVVDLDALTSPESAIAVRFVQESDACYAEVGWFVDTVHLYSCAESTDSGDPGADDAPPEEPPPASGGGGGGGCGCGSMRLAPAMAGGLALLMLARRRP